MRFCSGQYGGGFGAAWTYRGYQDTEGTYFAANNGIGIFELVSSSVDLKGVIQLMHDCNLPSMFVCGEQG